MIFPSSCEQQWCWKIVNVCAWRFKNQLFLLLLPVVYLAFLHFFPLIFCCCCCSFAFLLRAFSNDMILSNFYTTFAPTRYDILLDEVIVRTARKNNPFLFKISIRVRMLDVGVCICVAGQQEISCDCAFMKRQNGEWKKTRLDGLHCWCEPSDLTQFNATYGTSLQLAYELLMIPGWVLQL